MKDQVYVLGRDEITRLLDLNQDGEADVYENFNNDVSITPNFHEFALDLQADAAGNFYFTKGGPLLGTDYWDPTRTDPPLCWLPFAVDNSAGGQVWAGPQFGPLSGELIHLSYGKCRAFHVLSQDQGRRVRIEVPEVVPAMQLMVRGTLRTADGAELPVEYYGSINAVPGLAKQ